MIPAPRRLPPWDVRAEGALDGVLARQLPATLATCLSAHGLPARAHLPWVDHVSGPRWWMGPTDRQPNDLRVRLRLEASTWELTWQIDSASETLHAPAGDLRQALRALLPTDAAPPSTTPWPLAALSLRTDLTWFALLRDADVQAFASLPGGEEALVQEDDLWTHLLEALRLTPDLPWIRARWVARLARWAQEGRCALAGRAAARWTLLRPTDPQAWRLRAAIAVYAGETLPDIPQLDEPVLP